MTYGAVMALLPHSSAQLNEAERRRKEGENEGEVDEVHEARLAVDSRKRSAREIRKS
jgi:hypothetical protein